jgi:hypothetical protein
MVQRVGQTVQARFDIYYFCLMAAWQQTGNDTPDTMRQLTLCRTFPGDTARAAVRIIALFFGP